MTVTDGGNDQEMTYPESGSPAHHPEGGCPECGEPYRHYPRGLEAEGTTVYWTCANCNHAIKAERERRAQR